MKCSHSYNSIGLEIHCQKTAKVFFEGVPFCTVHDPAYVNPKTLKVHLEYEKKRCPSCKQHDEFFYTANYCRFCGFKYLK